MVLLNKCCRKLLEIISQRCPLKFAIRRIEQLSKKEHIPITLMYHRVDPNRTGVLNVSPEHFETQMKVLKQLGFVFLFEREWERVFEKSVLVSFDDGYFCNYYNAFPIFKKYKIKATINIIADRFFNEADTECFGEKEYYEMLESGLVDFECHTLTHKNLVKCNDRETSIEISDSKKLFETKLGKPFSIIVYPQNSITPKIYQTVRTMYEKGFSDINCSEHEIPLNYRIPRIAVYDNMGREELIRAIYNFMLRCSYQKIFRS